MTFYEVAFRFFFRTNIDPLGYLFTPLHVACEWEREEIALFLIKTERDIIRKEGDKRHGRQGGAGEHSLPTYNMQTSYGVTPVFMRTESARIVEELLTFDDLKVMRGDEMPLLWRCARNGCVSETVATDVKLAGQYMKTYNGTLPLEIGEHLHLHENALQICRFLKMKDD